MAHFNKKKSLETIQYWDKFKIDRALENGFSVIKLNQDNVWKNHHKTDWLDGLLAAIDTVRISEEPVSYGYAY